MKIILFLAVFLVISQFSPAMPAEPDFIEKQVCAVLITGIGCSSCANVEPIILLELTSQIPELVILKYEIYELHESNNPVFKQYINSYLSPREPRVIPFLILNREKYFRGEMEVRMGIHAIRETPENMCPLPDGNSASWMLLNLDALPGKVKIFTKNRVFFTRPHIDEKAGFGGSDIHIKELIRAKDVNSALKDMDFKEAEPEPVYIAEGKISFQKAVEIGKWKLQWNE